MHVLLSTIFGYDPAYVHVVVNHFPLFAMVSAALPLLVGLIGKSRGAAVAGLLLMMLASAGVGFTMFSGEAAYEAFEQGTMLRVMDAASHELLEVHEHRAHDWAKVAYVAGGLAFVGLLAVAWSGKAVRPVAFVGLVLCLGVAGVLGWIAKSGGSVAHVEFRDPADILETPATAEPHNESEHGHAEH